MMSGEQPGVIGILCGAETAERVLRKTRSGPLHKAVCNRWHGHEGKHRHVRGKNFATPAEWTDAECGAPDVMAQRRKEMALAARVGEVRVVGR
jgi:hypothetical protein